MNAEKLKVLSKTTIPKFAEQLSSSDIEFLVETLNEKNDTVRYNAFLLLQANSRKFPYMYLYWDELEKKLESPNSYQRSIGLMLIAENVRWDKEGKFNKTVTKYLSCCMDEKFITARQAIQGLENVIESTDQYDVKIKEALESLMLSNYKENQQRLISKDIANIFKLIEKKSK